MREPLRDRERLEHILSAINVLLANKDRHTLDEVVADPIIFYGYVKQVEIIGEAVYRLTAKFREEHPEVIWYTKAEEVVMPSLAKKSEFGMKNGRNEDVEIGYHALYK